MSFNDGNGPSSTFSLDEILAEVKAGKQKYDEPAEKPLRQWNLEEINRLLDGTLKSEPASVFSQETEEFPLSVDPEPGEEPKKDAEPVSEPSGEAEVLESDAEEENTRSLEPKAASEPVSEPEEPLSGDTVVFKPVSSDEPKTSSRDGGYVGIRDDTDYFGIKNEPLEELPEKPEPFFDEEADAFVFGGAEGKAASIEDNASRAHFFSTIELEAGLGTEPEPDPDETIEKPGVIIEKNTDFSKTSDLSPLPKIISVDDALRASEEDKTIVSGSLTRGEFFPAEPEIDDGQIILSGFDSADEPERVDERTVEESLLEKRRDTVSTFSLVNETISAEEKRSKRAAEKAQIDSDFPLEEKVEYESPAHRSKILNYLNSLARQQSVKSVLLGVAFALSLIGTLLPHAFSAFSDSGDMIYELSSTGTGILYLCFLIFSSLVCITDISAGIKKLFAKNPDSDTFGAVVVFASLLQSVFTLALGEGESASAGLYTVSAVFFLFLNSVAKRLLISHQLDAFKICAFKSSDSLYGIRTMENAHEAQEVGRGMMMGVPEILYSGKVGFSTGLLESTSSGRLISGVFKKLLPIACGAALVAGIISLAVSKSFAAGISSFAGALLIAAPVFSAVLIFYLRSEDKELRGSNCVVTGYDAAEECGKALAVVVDSADLFDRSRCEMHGMKDFNNVRIDDVLLYAAAMVIKSGGPLTDIFDQVIMESHELLPPVKSLSYEDKMGLSAWIHGQKVFLGNRNLLTNHNIDVPSKGVEDRYMRDGRKVMYLAIADRIAALFVVSYKPDENLIQSLQKIANSGMHILVQTSDSNITTDLLSSRFSLPPNSMKVIRAAGGRIFRKYRDSFAEELPAEIIHDGTAYTLLKSICSALSLNSTFRLLSVLQIVLSSVGLASFILGIFIKSSLLANPLFVLAYQLVCLVAMIIIYHFRDNLDS